MAAITMQSTSSLATKLAQDFPIYSFIPGEDFLWSPNTQTIFYIPNSTDTASFLHELAHGILGHTAYNKDIELLGVERAAWECATDTLASRYDVDVTPDLIEEALDTYRDWLHARSTCPSCSATGIQTKKDEYTCIACHGKWRVNDARVCALRRYKLPQ
jgi:hypothetical protein